MVLSLKCSTCIVLTLFLIFSVLVISFGGHDTASVPDAHRLVRDTRETWNNQTYYPDNQYKRLFYFIHVTDLHFSMFDENIGRWKEFQEFVSDTVMTVIKPPVVVCSGDLVDSISPTILDSHQNLQEWQMYQSVLKETKVMEQIEWLDIRGNHDNLNVASLESKENYFQNMSAQGPKHQQSYSYVHATNDGQKYAFIGIDTCLFPGARRPFNFLGSLYKDKYNELVALRERTVNSNYTIWFGHHPTGLVVPEQKNIRDFIGGSGPYLCGHLHTGFNLAKRMFLFHSSPKLLEVELGDWKINRIYRVATVDNGLFNFRDTVHKKWPVIVISNPKNALFHVASEPLERIRASTHIRVIVFSPHDIRRVEVRLGGAENAFVRMQKVDKTHLYIAEWNPQLYTAGLHSIAVRAEDEAGNRDEESYQFSLDGTRPPYPLGGRFFLKLSPTCFRAFFLFLVFSSTLPLWCIRIVFQSNRGLLAKRERDPSLWSRQLFKMALLASVDRLFYPLIVFPFYVALGPWFIGEIVTGHWSIVFSWGMFVKGTMLPGGLIYIFAIILMGVYFIPFEIALSNTLYATYRQHYPSYSSATPTRLTPFSTSCVFRNSFMITLILGLTVWASVFWLAYGIWAFFLGFLTSGSVIFSLYMWRVSITMKKGDFMAALGAGGGSSKAFLSSSIGFDASTGSSSSAGSSGVVKAKHSSDEEGPLKRS